MTTGVYLVKRLLKGKKKNGQREYRWVLRWEAADGWKCESTGTADRTQAESLQKVKWAELNIPGAALSPAAALDAEAAAAGSRATRATWQDCRDALRRSMEADNLRPASVSDYLMAFETLRRLLRDEAACPADVTPALANEFKRRRAEGWTKVADTFARVAPTTIKGDLSTLKAIFGKWLGQECGLVASNPFADVRPPKCDEPDVRIVTADESQALFAWLAERWNNWRLPTVYLEVAALLGWRATEIASMREDDLLADGYVQVLAGTVKTRRHKYGRLTTALHAELRACAAGGWAFGKFADDLRRLLGLLKQRHHNAAQVRDFSPERLVGWLQDELQRFHADRRATAKESGQPAPPTFTLHDFRRTAISEMQMAGVTEKECSVMVGATPEVIRKHYEKLDGMAIAASNLRRREASKQPAHSLRAGCAPAS